MRAHLTKPVVNLAGDLQNDEAVVIRVLQPGTETLLADVLYQGDTGTAFYTNPFTVTNGILDFYLAVPTRVRLRVTVGSEEDKVYEDVDVLSPVLPIEQVETPTELLLKSPNGTEWSITIDNLGILHSTDA